MKAILRDKLYIPMQDITEDHIEFIESKFRTVLYNEQGCNACSNKPDRPNNQCRGCDSFVGDYKFYAYTNNGKYVGIDVGRRDLVSSLFSRMGDVEVDDRRPSPQFVNTGLRFNYKVAYDYQVPAIKEMAKLGRGVLESQPRTGKTVMCAGIVISLGMKAIIIAHQDDLLTQCYNTFMNIDTDGIKFTNAPRFDNAVGFCKKLPDFEKYDICLVSYQTFLSKGGQKLLKQISSMFGTVAVDECFPSGTQVLLHGGTAESIDSIIDRVKGGDDVYVSSTDHTTGVIEPRRVISFVEKVVTELVEIETEFGVLRCTPNHPIWSETRQQYVEAQHLQVTDVLRSIDFISL